MGSTQGSAVYDRYRVKYRLAFCGAMTALLVTACPTPQPHLPPPGNQNVADLTGRQGVKVTEGSGQPLIVDWKNEQRAELEVAMRGGVAVVAYEGNAIRLLPDCKLEGTYGFYGVSQKVQVVRLENEQEIRANLPLGGAGLIAKLGGSLGSGSTVDVALVMIGKTRTTWRDPHVEDLKGSCKGATHFVRGAVVGAFAMDVGSRSEARAVAELFGGGGGARRSQASSVYTKDGSPDACSTAGVEDAKPPTGCQALIRLELQPIVDAQTKTAAPVAKTQQAEEELKCPEGMVLAQGKCTAKGAAPYVCKYGNAAECKEQCNKGSAESCVNLSVMAFHGEGVPVDKSLGAALADKACRAGNARGCTNSGVSYANGLGVAQDQARATLLFEEGCKLGDVLGCTAAGVNTAQGLGVTRNATRAAMFYQRACDGGDQAACTNLSVLYMGGDGVPQDGRKALLLNMRACDGGVSAACGNVGLHYEFGRIIQQDPGRAVQLFERACRMETRDCVRLGIVHQSGFGVPQNDNRAREIYSSICQLNLEDYMKDLSCTLLNSLYGGRNAVNATSLQGIIPTMKPQCDQADVERACGFLGAAYVGLNDLPAARTYLKKACDLKDYWACDLLKRLRL